MVVDDPARLLDDRPADLLGRPVPAHPGGRGLEDLELGGPCLGLLEQLGIGEGDRGVGREGRDERDVAARPGPRLAGDRRQRADDPVVVDERRDQVAGDLEGGVVRLPRVLVIAADVRVGQDVPGAQDLADPALVATEDRQAPGQLVGETGPGRDLEEVVAQDADRRRVGAQGALGLVDDHPEELGPIVRGGQPSGDPEDRVESLGELGLEGATRRCGSAGDGCRGGAAGSSTPRSVPGEPADERTSRGGGRALGEFGASATSRPGQGDRDRRQGARARPDGRTAGTGRGPAIGPGRGQDHRPGVVRAGGPDPLTARARPDYTPAASRPLVATTVRSRIRGQHNPWTTVPVPSTARPPSSPGTRSVPLPDG